MTMDKIKSLDKDDFLNMLGLETRRSTVDYLVPALAIFGVGVLVGTGIGLLVAPRPGRELRDDLAHRLRVTRETRIPQREEVVNRQAEQVHSGLGERVT